MDWQRIIDLLQNPLVRQFIEEVGEILKPRYEDVWLIVTVILCLSPILPIPGIATSYIMVKYYNGGVSIKNKKDRTSLKIKTRELRLKMIDTFSLDELRMLCADLNENYNVIIGENPKTYHFEVVNYFLSRNRIIDLIEYCHKERPHVEWSAFIDYGSIDNDKQ
jgi:hypothetical protein